MVSTLAARPRVLLLASAIAATGLGLAYMVLAGAPARYLAMNAAALVAGLLLVPLIGRSARFGGRVLGQGVVAIGLGLALLATAWLGLDVEGANRWLSLGGVVIQPSLIAIPLLVVLFARRGDGLTALGVTLAAAALAIQPDRAMAGTLVAGLAVLTIFRRDRTRLAVLGVSAVGFAVTLVRPDALPATPFVDQVFRTAFATHPLAGLAVYGGAALLLLPAALGLGRAAGHREIWLAFGAVWAAIIASAMLGNYPTPLVGYGGSAIVGYLLCAIVLPRAIAPDSAATLAVEPISAHADTHTLRLETA